MSRPPRPAAALLVMALAACEGGTGGAAAPVAEPDTGAVSGGSEAAVIAAALADTAGTRRLVYVPVYSQIHYRDDRNLVSLAVTLSVRNTDPEHPITLHLVRYYDTPGRALRSYLAQPLRLGPLASTQYVVPARDRAGGTGANFLVQWSADGEVTEPIIEAIMIGTEANLGISFTSPGRPLTRR